MNGSGRRSFSMQSTRDYGSVVCALPHKQNVLLRQKQTTALEGARERAILIDQSTSLAKFPSADEAFALIQVE